MNERMTRRLPLLGRQDERKKIAQAIQGQGPPILFLEGRAGIGKTFLLEEAGQIAQEQEALCPPIVDFYDTEMHAHRALEAAIASILDQEKKIFKEYWDRREEMERTLLRKGTLKEQEEELWELFLNRYQKVAKENRVVLRFDTAELLEYERDSKEVLKDCEVSPQDAPSWEWLLKRIGELENTTILIAARPTPTGLLKQRLLEVHGDSVLHLPVEGFTLEETETYFRTTDFGDRVADESPEMVAKIHLLSGGRPILIALALDWLERGTWEPHIYPASLKDLKTWQAEAREEERSGQREEAWRRWDRVKRNFESALVQQIRALNHTGLDDAVKYVALARKGCNAELLSRLMEVSLEKAKELVEELLTLSFVKPPRGPRQLFFLHDEMYDLVEEYIWMVDWPDYSKQAQLDETIIDWYTEQIEDLEQRIKDCQEWQERADLRGQQQLWEAKRLYYQFDTDPREGYRQYYRLDEAAIGSREHEFDTLLRNEALWFTAHRGWRVVEKGPTRRRNGRIERAPWVDHDCRRRWVSRYVARGEWEKAERIAQKLLEKEPRAEEPELYRGGVRVGMATAQAYMGGKAIESALENFEKGIKAIKKAIEQAPEERQNPWLSSYLLGTAYLYKGLALRSTFQPTETADAYRQANHYYRQIDYQPGLGEALNNLAYIYARWGKPERALGPCNEAMEIRRELGAEYPIGLSLNTKGIIYERCGLPETAIKFSQQALETFQSISSERGIVLAEINLGRSLRRKGRSPDWSEKGDFEKGRDYLQSAIDLLEGWGDDREVFYEVEAYNELGCLYRDWVATLYERGGRDRETLRKYLRSAAENLEHSRSLLRRGKTVPKRHVYQYVDSTEDLARVHYWWARVEPEKEEELWDEALILLDEATSVTEEYLSDQPESSFLLGKIYCQYARIAQEQEEKERAAKYYAKAAGTLEGYSRYLPELQKTVDDSCEWLCTFDQEGANQHLKIMRSTLQEESLESSRLREWVDDVVQPRTGVRWPRQEEKASSRQEVVNG